jgi:hypothetical protein
MNITISEAIRNSPQSKSCVDQANQTLKEVIGRYDNRVSASWEYQPFASGTPKLVLVLTDSSGATTEALFTASDFASKERLKARLYTVWGDLLQDLSHKQLSQMAGGVGG